MLGSLFDLFTLQTLVSGVVGAAGGGLATWVLNLVKERSLAKHKEELGRESTRLTNEFNSASNRELERLKNELGQSTEAFKLTLRKQEWLFDKELEAANAFLEWRGQYVPTPIGASFDSEAAADAAYPSRFQIEKPMRDLITAHAAVLPTSIRLQLRSAYNRFSDSLIRANALHPDVGKTFVCKALMKLMEDADSIEQKLFELIRS